MFDCAELVTQQLRKFRATFRVCGYRLKLCLGKMSDGKLAVLHQRHRCVYHGRQLGRSGITSTALHGKENSVHHQIRFHSVVGASLHQRNTCGVFTGGVCCTPQILFQAAGFTVRGGVSVMASFPLLAAHVQSSWP